MTTAVLVACSRSCRANSLCSHRPPSCDRVSSRCASDDALAARLLIGLKHPYVTNPSLPRTYAALLVRLPAWLAHTATCPMLQGANTRVASAVGLGLQLVSRALKAGDAATLAGPLAALLPTLFRLQVRALGVWRV